MDFVLLDFLYDHVIKKEKTIDVRCASPYFAKVVAGSSVTISSRNRECKKKILRREYYPSLSECLANINIEQCLPRVKDVREGICFFHRLNWFEGMASRYGVYAFYLGDEDDELHDVTDPWDTVDDILVEPEIDSRETIPVCETSVTSEIDSRETIPVCETSVTEYCYVTTFREWCFATLGLICEALESMDCIWTVESNVISVESEVYHFGMIDFICGIDGRVEFCTKKVKKDGAKKRKSSFDEDGTEREDYAKKRKSSFDEDGTEREDYAKKRKSSSDGNVIVLEGGFDNFHGFDDYGEVRSKQSLELSTKDDESYASWIGPDDYDKSVKRSNFFKHMGHKNIICRYSEDCEFNSRPVDERSIYNLNRHFVTDHVLDMSHQSEALGDIFAAWSNENRQR